MHMVKSFKLHLAASINPLSHVATRKLDEKWAVGLIIMIFKSTKPKCILKRHSTTIEKFQDILNIFLSVQQ